MLLTRAADYAVRVLIHLATLPPGSRVQRATLAQATGVPESFLSKVLQSLVRASLIASQTGVNGGFELTASAETLTLLDVLEAIDGPLGLNTCVATGQRCERQESCPAHPVWIEAQEAVSKVLRAATIARLAKPRIGTDRAGVGDQQDCEGRASDKILPRLHGSSHDRTLI